MIWAAIPALRRPGWKLRAFVDGLLILLGGYLMALVFLDDVPPYANPTGVALKAQVARGEWNEVQWELVDQRYCSEVTAYRSLLSSADASWETNISISPVAMNPDRPRPVYRTGTSLPLLTPPSFPVDKVPGNLTTAYYQVDIVAACNWLQEWLPERFRIRQRLPTISWQVTNGPPIQVAPPPAPTYRSVPTKHDRKTHDPLD